MLSYANLQPRIPPGFCCVGSPPVAGGGDVCALRHARRGGPRAERDVGRDQSLVSGVAGEGPARAEGRGPRGPQTAPRPDRLGEAGAGIAGRASGAGLSTAVWTLPRVATVIERLTGVVHHPGHV